MNLFYARWFLLGLMIVNAIGTVWGVAWYWDQLSQTPWYFLPFVPDSPLHAMLFGCFIFWLYTGSLEHLGLWRQLIAWAGVLGGIKYGLWTTVIISQYLLSPGAHPSPEDWMLYASHGGMALQAAVYMNRLPRVIFPAALVILWLAVNDFFDYIFFTHPRLPLPDEIAVAAWTNVILTGCVAVIAYKLLDRQLRETKMS